MSAHVISRSDVYGVFAIFFSKESTRPIRVGFSLLLNFIAIGSLSPPFRPSQSAYKIGISELKVWGSG